MPPRRTTRTPRRLVHRDLREQARKDGVYDSLFRAQDGKCAICRKPPKPDGKGGTASLDLDHDHRTLVIRGLLCRGCNMRLRQGMTPAWMRQAADYLDGVWAHT